VNKVNDSRMKVDLVMWAKNGAKTLPRVLKRIDEVIPEKNIINKIFVDDHSIDGSVEIAKSFAWKVYENKEGFISGGASEALKYATSPFFISVEQDVLLAKDWWRKIPKYIEGDPKVAVAQGIRFSTIPVFRCLEEYLSERFEPTQVNISLDNNIFRTSIIKKLGGFPRYCPISVDLELFDVLHRAQYKWVVDRSVVSDHIRESVLREVLDHQKFMMAKREQWLERSSLQELLRILASSPLRATHIMIKKKCPEIFFIYPFMRLTALKNFLNKKRQKRLDDCN